ARVMLGSGKPLFGGAFDLELQECERNRDLVIARHRVVGPLNVARGESAPARVGTARAGSSPKGRACRGSSMTSIHRGFHPVVKSAGPSAVPCGPSMGRSADDPMSVQR